MIIIEDDLGKQLATIYSLYSRSINEVDNQKLGIPKANRGIIVIIDIRFCFINSVETNIYDCDSQTHRSVPITLIIHCNTVSLNHDVHTFQTINLLLFLLIVTFINLLSPSPAFIERGQNEVPMASGLRSEPIKSTYNFSYALLGYYQHIRFEKNRQRLSIRYWVQPKGEIR